jgi:hypothetical protein
MFWIGSYSLLGKIGNIIPAEFCIVKDRETIYGQSYALSSWYSEQGCLWCRFFFLFGCLILILCEMSLHDDSNLDGGEIPLSSEVTENLCIHLMSIKGANKKLRTKIEDMSANIKGVEDRLNARLTTSDRQQDDSLQVVTESLNRLTAAVQRLEARDATPRQSRSPRRSRNQFDADVSDLSDARGGYQRRP